MKRKPTKLQEVTEIDAEEITLDEKEILSILRGHLVAKFGHDRMTKATSTLNTSASYNEDCNITAIFVIPCKGKERKVVSSKEEIQDGANGYIVYCCRMDDDGDNCNDDFRYLTKHNQWTACSGDARIFETEILAHSGMGKAHQPPKDMVIFLGKVKNGEVFHSYVHTKRTKK